MRLAPDQRYCLQCGERRGEPRLPFMDAVVFMDAMKPAAAPQPSAPAAESKPRISPSASLIAGVATLILAIGVGVLIGQSGDSGTQTAAATPQIIKVGGGGEEVETATSGGKGGGKSSGGKNGKSGKGKTPEKEIDSSGTSEAAAEILKPAGDVKLPPPTVQPGGECESGTAGCDGGKFDGNFFGE